MYYKETEYTKRPDFISPSNIKGKINTLKEFYYHKYEEESKKVTPAQQRNFNIGSAIHCLMLEPSEFEKRFSTEKKEEGITVLKPEDYNMIFDMRQAAQDTIPDIDTMLLDSEESLAEHTFYALYTFSEYGQVLNIESVDRETTKDDIKDNQLLCRAIPDYLRKKSYIVELKSTINISPDGFSKDIASFGYDIQQTMTNDIVNAVIGVDHDFFFLAIGKTKPHDAIIYQVNPDQINAARQYYQKFLFAICTAFKTGKWVGYDTSDTKVVEIDLPVWRLHTLNKAEF